MHIDRRLLGWGLFFILVGAIPLATRAGVLDPAAVRAWPSLWPLLLIGWGLGLVLRRTPVEWLGGAVTAVIFGIIGGGLLAAGFSGSFLSSGCGGEGPGKAFATETGTLPSVGRLDVELHCGSLTVQPVEGTAWSVSGTESNGKAPLVRVAGTNVTIGATERGSFVGDELGRTDWTVGVPTVPEVALGLTVNAGETRADLAGTHLRAVNLTVNAGSARLDLDGATSLGDVHANVNAGSAVVRLPFDISSATLSLNAGSLDLCLAAGTPVRVTWSGTLGSNDFDRAGLMKLDDSTWQSTDFNPLSSYLDLRVSATAGSFHLDTDGTCDA
jgi:hypothetical protein